MDAIATTDLDPISFSVPAIDGQSLTPLVIKEISADA